MEDADATAIDKPINKLVTKTAITRTHPFKAIALRQILVIDDDRDFADSMADILSAEGYELTVVNTGDKALEVLHDHTIEVALLDIRLGRENGVELIPKLRALNPRLACILLTGYASLDTAITGMRNGACDYLRKPVSIDLLLTRLQEIFSQPPLPQANAASSAQPYTEKEQSGYYTQLEKMLAKNSLVLENLQHEWEGFNRSLSHDLRAPLRTISGFSHLLLEDYAEKLDDTACGYINRMHTASSHMHVLLDELMALARLSGKTMEFSEIDLSDLAQKLFSELQAKQPERQVAVSIQPGLKTEGDYQLLETACSELFANAWKFTGNLSQAEISFRAETQNGITVFAVADNGAGFDMRYAHKLFQPFQRLHASNEFSGKGVGLSKVQCIIQKHRGRIWFEAEPGAGTTCYFTLGEAYDHIAHYSVTP